jgi:hypothetical protein
MGKSAELASRGLAKWLRILSATCSPKARKVDHFPPIRE